MLGLHLFQKRTVESNTQTDKLLFLIKELTLELDILKNKFKIMETNYNDLRGKFNRKLSPLQKQESEKEDITEETQNKDINKTVFLTPNGNPI